MAARRSGGLRDCQGRGRCRAPQHGPAIADDRPDRWRTGHRATPHDAV